MSSRPKVEQYGRSMTDSTESYRNKVSGKGYDLNTNRFTSKKSKSTTQNRQKRDIRQEKRDIRQEKRDIRQEKRATLKFLRADILSA